MWLSPVAETSSYFTSLKSLTTYSSVVVGSNCMLPLSQLLPWQCPQVSGQCSATDVNSQAKPIRSIWSASHAQLRSPAQSEIRTTVDVTSEQLRLYRTLPSKPYPSLREPLKYGTAAPFDSVKSSVSTAHSLSAIMIISLEEATVTYTSVVEPPRRLTGVQSDSGRETVLYLPSLVTWLSHICIQLLPDARVHTSTTTALEPKRWTSKLVNVMSTCGRISNELPKYRTVPSSRGLVTCNPPNSKSALHTPQVLGQVFAMSIQWHQRSMSVGLLSSSQAQAVRTKQLRQFENEKEDSQQPKLSSRTPTCCPDSDCTLRIFAISCCWF